MLAVALALIVVGIVLGFFLPWVGWAPAVLGLVLLVLFLAGVTRRTTERRA